MMLSNPAKVMYPALGLTKMELAEYYAGVSHLLLPHVAKRPLMILRCPHGQEKQCFYQKHVTEAVPPEIHGVAVMENGEIRRYIALDGPEGILALIQLGTLEIHAWASPERDVEKPDRIIFDLDPDPAVAWSEVIKTALILKDVLAGFGLTSFVKTSGGKGLHIVAPVSQAMTWDMAKGFARVIAEDLARENPDRFIATMSKARRKGRIFVDYLRTGRGSTCVAAYSTRARPGAPVSTPLTWEELPDCPSSDQFTVKNLPDRLARLKADPWQGFFRLRQSIKTHLG